MQENIKFYKNNKDGSVVTLHNGKLNDEFVLLEANKVDAAFEKHVPVYEINNDKILVKIGDVFHPMTDEHYIMWIAYVYDNKVEYVYLNPGDLPQGIFEYIKGADIYAYCNLHGLWKTTVK